MVAVAVALFVAFSSASSNLEKSCDSTYEQLKFLDFYVPLRNVDSAAVARVERIPGVVAACGRRVSMVRILLGQDQEANARVIGSPVFSRPEVNDLFIHEGRYLQAQRGEALLERRFAAAHNIGVGQRIRLKRRYAEAQSYLVVGLVSSPEFIWLADDRLDPRPAARRLAIVYLSQSDACSLDGQSGFNDIQVRVSKPDVLVGAMSEARQALLANLQDNPVPRAEQASHSLLIRDRRAFAGVAVLFPLVFLSLATLTLLATLWQLVVGQRKLVGVMMANGISDVAIVGHYLFLCTVIAGVGSVAGVLMGHPLGVLCTRYYADSLGLPLVVTEFYPVLALTGATATVLVALLTGWRATHRLLGMEPAEVLRVEFAPIGRLPRLERWVPGLSRAGYLFRLPLRNLMRQPLRNLGVFCSLGFSVAILVMALTFYDSQRHTLEFFFNQVHRYDLQVDLLQPTSPSSLPTFSLWPGVRRVEFFLGAALHLQGARDLEKRVWGIPPDSRLLRLFDSAHQPLHSIPEDAVVMGPLPMVNLGVHSGSRLKLRYDLPQQRGRETALLVGPELFEPVSNPPKLALNKLQEIMSGSGAFPRDGVNIVLLGVEPDKIEAVHSRLYSSPFVGEVTNVHQYKEDVRLLLRLANAYFALMALFSGLLAFTLLVASSTMTVADRAGEIATLAVLGLSESTLAGMLVVETLVLWLGGILIGVPGGYALGNWLLNHYQSDLIQMQLDLSAFTIMATTMGSLLLCLLATLYSLRQVLQIPLSDATRSAS